MQITKEKDIALYAMPLNQKEHITAVSAIYAFLIWIITAPGLITA
jgi:hypothetical protein